MRKRQASRVLLFNPQGEILLVHFAIPRDGADFHFWATPGGEIEAGESPEQAMRREIVEELGLDLTLEGPLWTDQNCFLHQGQMCDNTDFYFRALCSREAPKLLGVTEDELKIMKEIRWWTLAELDATSEKIFPVDLIPWIRKLLGL
jgi:8-oxo-dGTP pyrophosphatase MutT (NUDIX family)